MIENKSKTLFISASLMIVATNAMASVARDSDTVFSIGASKLNDESAARLKAVATLPEVQYAIGSSAMLITGGFGTNGVAAIDQYFSKDDLILGNYILASSDDFSGTGVLNVPSVTCYGNCHSACHGACHGSRGWR